MMIQKVAESQALRKAFAINGIYSQEEDRTIGPDTDMTKRAGAVPVSPVIDAESPPSPAPVTAQNTKRWTKVPPKIFDP